MAIRRKFVGNTNDHIARSTFTKAEHRELNECFGQNVRDSFTKRLYYSIFINCDEQRATPEYCICFGPCSAIVAEPVPLDYLVSLKKVCCAEIRFQKVVSRASFTPLTNEDAERISKLIVENPEPLQSVSQIDIQQNSCAIIWILKALCGVTKLNVNYKFAFAFTEDRYNYIIQHSTRELSMQIDQVHNPETLRSAITRFLTSRRFESLSMTFSEENGLHYLQYAFFEEVIYWWTSVTFVERTRRSREAELCYKTSLWDPLVKTLRIQPNRFDEILAHGTDSSYTLQLTPVKDHVCDFAFRLL